MRWPWTGNMYNVSKTRLGFNCIGNITRCFIFTKMKEYNHKTICKIPCMLTVKCSPLWPLFAPSSSLLRLPPLVVSACRNTFLHSTCWSGALMTALDVKWFPLHFFFSDISEMPRWQCRRFFWGWLQRQGRGTHYSVHTALLMMKLGFVSRFSLLPLVQCESRRFKCLSWQQKHFSYRSGVQDFQGDTVNS